MKRSFCFPVINFRPSSPFITKGLCADEGTSRRSPQIIAYFSLCHSLLSRDKLLVPSSDGTKKAHLSVSFILVRMKGLEPPRLSAPDPKSGAATNYATSAGAPKIRLFSLLPIVFVIIRTPLRRCYFIILNSSVSLPSRPRGEIGKRCGLRSRWCNYLGSSSLPAGTIR